MTALVFAITLFVIFFIFFIYTLSRILTIIDIDKRTALQRTLLEYQQAKFGPLNAGPPESPRRYHAVRWFLRTSRSGAHRLPATNPVKPCPW